MAVKHTFVSGKAASADSTLIDGPNWDDNHNIEANTVTRAQSAASGKNWEFVGSANLGSAAASLSLTLSGTARKHIVVRLYIPSQPAAAAPLIQFNSDTGNNYARSVSDGVTAPTTATATSGILLNQTTSANGKVVEFHILNISAKSKKVFGRGMVVADTGAAAAPVLVLFAGVWNNTAGLITSIQIQGNGQNLAAGSEIIAWARDDD
jgi:hypothetical protein